MGRSGLWLTVIFSTLLVASACGTVAQTIPQSITGAIRLTADLGVPGDGVTSISTILPARLATVPAGSRVIFDAPRYHVTTTLFLLNLPAGLTLAGNGSVLYRNAGDPRDTHVVHVEGYDRLTIEDLFIEGNETNWRYDSDVEFSSGMLIRSGTGITVRRVSVARVGGDGFNIRGHVPNPARRVLLEDVRLQRVARQGISVRNVDGVVIRGASGSWIGRSAFDLEPAASDWYVRNTEIVDSFMTHFQNYFLAGGGAGPVESLRFTGNRAVGGIGFAAIGAQVRAGTVVIGGNTYTWNDPEYVQDRALQRVNIHAADLTFENNDLTFNTPLGGMGMYWRLGRARIIHNKFVNVGPYQRDGTHAGLLIDAGGHPEAIQIMDLTLTDRNGQPLPVVIR